MEAEIQRVRDALRAASAVSVWVGPQLSAESSPGPGDSIEGEWDAADSCEIATPEAFRQQPQRVWSWYVTRRMRIGRRPLSPALRALNDLVSRLPRAQLITANVDGSLERHRASLRPLELHGNVWRTRCTGCGRLRVDDRASHPELPPRCRHCGGMLRPDVVWFGEALNSNVLDQAVRAACASSVLLVVGGHTRDQPAASLAAHAHENGALVVELGPEGRVGGLCDLALTGPLDEMIQALVLAGLTRPPAVAPAEGGERPAE